MSDPSDPRGRTEKTTMCERIVTTVADAKGVDATTLPPLYEVVDPECLNGIFDPTARGVARTGGVISFRWAGCRVLVDGTDVTVTPEDSVATSSSAGGAGGRSEGLLD